MLFFCYLFKIFRLSIFVLSDLDVYALGSSTFDLANDIIILAVQDLDIAHCVDGAIEADDSGLSFDLYLSIAFVAC